MLQPRVITDFPCPTCRAVLAPRVSGRTSCPGCGWDGEAHLFAAKAVHAATAEAALAEDATCVHHPRKRATTVCAGTGDYICSLCAVEIDGQTYCAEYLAAGGRAKAAKAFQRTLPRPDNHVLTYLLCLFVPYVNFLLIPFAFLWVPHGFVLYRRALRMRRENPLFARLMGPGRVVMLPVLLVAVSVLWVAGVSALLVGLSRGGW